MRRNRHATALGAALALACQASTTRPTFLPVPEAPSAEIRLPVADATRILAEALRVDSVPLTRVEPRDGYLESAWFGMPGFAPDPGRPLGPAVDRIRAWVNPGRPGPPATSIVTVEVIYRAFADPSRPARETERHVPEDHPAHQRVRAILRALVEQYGDPERVIPADSAPARPSPPPPPPPPAP